MSRKSLSEIFKKHYWQIIFILLLWVITTFFNITKPVHIDDSEYLQIAQHISKNPLHPMLGSFNMALYNGPLYKNANHPLLIPYLYSLVFYLFGESLIIFHLVISIFSMISVICIFLLARKLVPQYVNLISTMFILGPSFLPSQNLMIDIPLVSLWLSFFTLLLYPYKKSIYRYFLAGIILSLAILVKFASLILIPILLIDIILKKKWIRLWVLTIPLGTILAWSVFNYWDYGGIQIIGAAKTPFYVADLGSKLLLWLITLGSVTPFSFVFLPIMLTPKRLIILSGGAVSVAALAYFLWQFPGESVINSFLRVLFFGNGTFVSLLTLYCLTRQLIKINLGKLSSADHQYIILSLWFLLPSLFIIQFVPFLAVRHVLLVIPAIIIILTANLSSQIKVRWVYLGTFATLFLGVRLGLSDWHQADIYRTYAPKIFNQLTQQQKASKSPSTIWFGGFWDWQYYAQKAGMKEYDQQKSKLSPGDYFVMPATLRQQLNTKDALILKKVRNDTFPTTFFTYFKTLTNYPLSPAGFYAMVTPRHLPWTISTGPVETFFIFQVANPK